MAHTMNESTDDAEMRAQTPPLAAGDAMARILELSCGDKFERRVTSLFLGGSDFQPVCHSYKTIIGGLLEQALVGFVQSLGGRVIWSVRLNDNGFIVPVAQASVTVDGQVLRYVREGMLFIELPSDRVVVAMRYQEKVGDQFHDIDITSTGDPSAFHAAWRAYAREHHYLRNRAFFVHGELIDHDPTCTWDKIAIPNTVRKTLEMHVSGFLKHASTYRRLGLKRRRGLILAGPPGTGKTLLGRILANTLGVSFAWATPRHFFWSDATAKVMALVRFAAPVVLFLEDLDLFGDRDTERAGLLGELMNELDGATENQDVVTIATTNRLDVIEKALRNRPGRFDRVLMLDAMAAPSRQQLLGRLLAQAELAPGDMADLVSRTDGFTGAQVEELVNTLYMLAVEEEAARPADDGAPVPIPRRLIDMALAEVRVVRKPAIGFQAA